MKSNFFRPILNIIFALLLLSCKGEIKKKPIPIARKFMITASKDTLPIITPSVQEFEKLSPAYLKKYNDTLLRFANKYWSNPDKNISLLVAKNGQIIFEKYQGYANKNKAISIDYKTPLHIASVSKVITATAILLLIDGKKIELNQKVNTILNEFPYPNVTIKTLLNHRSGMQNYAYFVENKKVCSWSKTKVLYNHDILDLMVKYKIKLQSPTDHKFFYCNTNYAILALIIEKITGFKYPEAIKKMIFNPLNMNNSYVFEYDKDKFTAVPSYKSNNVEIGIDYLDAVYGDKNIYSTPQDLLKFDLARNAPQFLNPDLNAAIYKGYSNEHKGTKNYGLGLRMINWETGQNYYFHNGWWHGNTSSYISLKNENITIVALSNKFCRNTYVVRQIAPIFGDYPIKVDQDDTKMPDAAIGRE